MAKKMRERSQLLDLLLHVAEELGVTSDRAVAALADVGADNIANWRDGSVRELKAQTLKAAKRGLSLRLRAMRDQLRQIEAGLEQGLIPIEIEEASGPTALQRQFVDRMIYDYLGHRFLYFDPQGALAWENLIKAGYAQDCWLAGVERCVQEWLDPRRQSDGHARGPLAGALGLDGRGQRRGLDVVSLGPGEGGKEAIALDRLLTAGQGVEGSAAWLTLALVDVSIPLLLRAARAAAEVRRGHEADAALQCAVLPFCADFEEGDLSFMARLPTEQPQGEGGLRLVMALGNVFGNVRDEETFVRQRLLRLVRPGDFLWIDVGKRLENIEHDPVYPMTVESGAPTAALTNRRLLLEGPYRRWEAAIGRPPSEIETRIWMRESDDSCRVPGSLNFCHDLYIKSERRVCTMLYSRRYQLEALCSWFEGQGFEVVRVHTVNDSQQRQFVLHLLLRRR